MLIELRSILDVNVQTSQFNRRTKDYAQLHLENYVKTDEDWVAGKDILIRTGDQSDFRFSCSPFIYQGMCYLDEVIIKNIYGEE